MPLFKTKMKQTFSFAKLNRSIDKIARELVDTTGVTYEKIYKKRIDDGLLPPHTKLTKRLRKQGDGWNFKKVPPTDSEIPLKQTGALYRSLTYVKSDQTIKMLAYGQKHQKDFTNPLGFKVPARPFLQDVEMKKLDIMPKIRKAFKK